MRTGEQKPRGCVGGCNGSKNNLAQRILTFAHMNSFKMMCNAEPCEYGHTVAVFIMCLFVHALMLNAHVRATKRCDGGGSSSRGCRYMQMLRTVCGTSRTHSPQSMVRNVFIELYF